MRLLFMFGVLWLAYVYAGYPVILAIVGLLRRVHPHLSEDHLPKVSVLIAARNEEKDIEWKIRETLAWDYPEDRLEVAVVSDASTDRTDEIIGRINDKRLIFVRMDQRGGKNAALNYLVPRTSGEILFFTDANAHIEPLALRRMVRHFADKRVGCVSGQTEPLRNDESPISKGAGTYWSYEALVKRLETQIGSVLVCQGAIFCMRREIFSPLSPQLANDLESPFQAAKLGYWICNEPTVFAGEYETSSPQEEFARRRRICAQGALALGRLWTTLSPLRAWQFVSRKVLRWFTLVPLLIILLASIYLSNSLFYKTILILQLPFYLLALFGWLLSTFGRRTGGPLSIPYYTLLVCAAGLIGTVEACFGREFAVWDSSTMSRLGREDFNRQGLR
jgi:biofilm PGA synthesis N-glycosyltransferase PgaC